MQDKKYIKYGSLVHKYFSYIYVLIIKMNFITLKDLCQFYLEFQKCSMTFI